MKEIKEVTGKAETVEEQPKKRGRKASSKSSDTDAKSEPKTAKPATAAQPEESEEKGKKTTAERKKPGRKPKQTTEEATAEPQKATSDTPAETLVKNNLKRIPGKSAKSPKETEVKAEKLKSLREQQGPDKLLKKSLKAKRPKLKQKRIRAKQKSRNLQKRLKSLPRRVLKKREPLNVNHAAGSKKGNRISKNSIARRSLRLKLSLKASSRQPVFLKSCLMDMVSYAPQTITTSTLPMISMFLRRRLKCLPSKQEIQFLAR